MNNLDIAWLAGLWEGEGYFGVVYRTRASGNTHPRLTCEIKMTDLDIIERVARLLDGRIVTKKPKYEHYKMLYYVRLYDSRAAEFMRLIRPYMGIRRGARIDELLAIQDSR